MTALGKALTLSALVAYSASATTTLFQGVFSTDDQVQLFQFTLASSATVTLESFGYGGGVVGPKTISSGGFAPYAVLFALVGPDYVVSATDNGGHCPPAVVDLVTGNCDDPYIQTSLPAGTYFLGLSVWDNTPTTGTLADGYKQTGNPGFTCAEGGVGGQFCDVTDALFRSRTGDWAFAFTGVDSVTQLGAVPEPGTPVLMLPVIFLGAMLRRRLCQPL